KQCISSSGTLCPTGSLSTASSHHFLPFFPINSLLALPYRGLKRRKLRYAERRPKDIKIPIRQSLREPIHADHILGRAFPIPNRQTVSNAPGMLVKRVTL